MFGLFGKSEMENSTFNNALIASISDGVRKTGKFPTESQLFATIEDLAKGKKLAQSQISCIRACALELNSFSWPKSELMPLIIKMQKEMPLGGRESYDKILELLGTHAIIVTDDAYEFMKKYGMK
jgi:hypothetical protein